MLYKQLEADDEIILLTDIEQHWLTSVFERFNGYPNLQQIWMLMDEQWNAFGCNQNYLDSNIVNFYNHPIWLLNGWFIEQDPESMCNRNKIMKWVVEKSPSRVAEFGGGFGGLARLIGKASQKAQVEVIEPHPHPIAVARAEKTANVRFRSQMVGDYDVLLATDVFEHVPDPLRLVFETAQHLRIGGHYLIANCFYPVIRCHLPQTFHFRHSWDAVMRAMGLEPAEKVAYGRAFVRRGELNLTAARQVEVKSLKFWRFTQFLPRRIAQPVTNVLASF